MVRDPREGDISISSFHGGGIQVFKRGSGVSDAAYLAGSGAGTRVCSFVLFTPFIEHILNARYLQQPHEKGFIMTPILQLRTLRLRQVKLLARIHSSSAW